jgi:hypothetical protein
MSDLLDVALHVHGGLERSCVDAWIEDSARTFHTTTCPRSSCTAMPIGFCHQIPRPEGRRR